MSLVSFADLRAPAPSDPSQRVYERVGARIHAAAAPMPPPPYPLLDAAALAALDRWIAAAAPPGPVGLRCSGPSAGAEGNGYVELPYTLAQDYTLFVVLSEATAVIWKDKLDWIASRGGMALLNVHPDYVAFGGTAPRQHEYSAALYRDFLESLNQKYSGQYWHALPRDVATFFRKTVSKSDRAHIAARASDLRLFQEQGSKPNR
jgi:hypothetical protein